VKSHAYLNKIPQKGEYHVLVSMGGLIGSLYIPKQLSTCIVIEAPGAPCWGDTGTHKGWSECKKHNISLFVPDYLGSSRSNGSQFSMRNCLKTLYMCEQFVKGKISAKSVVDGKLIHIQFETILLIGSSFGGAVIPFYPREYPDTEVRGLGFLYPTTVWGPKEYVYPDEESDEEYLYLLENGWGNFYRNIMSSDWPGIILGREEKFIPNQNIDHLRGFWIYAVHGDQDNLVHWSRTKKYIELLKKNDPDNNHVYWKLISNAGHGEATEAIGYEVVVSKFVKDTY